MELEDGDDERRLCGWAFKDFATKTGSSKNVTLKSEFSSELYQSGGRGAHHLSEVGIVYFTID